MAEPSLLCVSCARPPPLHRRTWNRCIICVERNLPSTYYCGQECMNAHWPKHQQYHKEQKQRAKERREGTVDQRNRSIAEEVAREAEATGDELDKRFAEALAFGVDGDHHAAAKAWRRLIKEQPENPVAYLNLAVVLEQSGRLAEAAPMFLKAMEFYDDGTKDWAESAGSAFELLKTPDCRDVPTPEWWNDEALKALSARVVALAPDHSRSCRMRARVLSGDTLIQAQWNAGPRTAAEIKEAATWYRHAARTCRVPAADQACERMAQECDEIADPLLAKEEAEAAKARAAAEAEAAKARAAAEAKARAATEELLAEEEKEKKQAAASTTAGKAKPGKGKRGKGKR